MGNILYRWSCLVLWSCKTLAQCDWASYHHIPEIHLQAAYWNWSNDFSHSKCHSLPIGSMYSTFLFTYIYHENQPNVGKYTSPMDSMGTTWQYISAPKSGKNSCSRKWRCKEASSKVANVSGENLRWMNGGFFHSLHGGGRKGNFQFVTSTVVRITINFI